MTAQTSVSLLECPPEPCASGRGTLLAALVRRDLALRYKGFLLGAVWTWVHPVMFVGVYTFLFAGILEVGGPGYSEAVGRLSPEQSRELERVVAEEFEEVEADGW